MNYPAPCSADTRQTVLSCNYVPTNLLLVHYMPLRQASVTLLCRLSPWPGTMATDGVQQMRTGGQDSWCVGTSSLSPATSIAPRGPLAQAASPESPVLPQQQVASLGQLLSTNQEATE